MTSAVADQTTPRPRRQIGKYVVLSRLGRGGMGLVYRARDETLDRDVAIKILTLEGVFDSESRKRFEVEAKAAARLQHPNIVTIYELGDDRGVPFIAMELLHGIDLDTLSRSGEALLLEERLDIAIQVCRGLAYAHSHGVVHRDIKPSNIRLLDDGSVKIMDFGIAKLGGMALTQSGMMVGTAHYMSPEQVRGRPLDGRSDVFSVGVILHELLTGSRPFAGDTATEVLYKIAHEDAPRLPPAVVEQLPGAQAILDRALAKEAAGRQAGAAALADELGELLQRLSPRHPLSAEEQEALTNARRLASAGQADAGLDALTTLVARNPSCVEAVRARRTLLREQRTKDRLERSDNDTFPELDATFHVPGAHATTETVPQPLPARPVAGLVPKNLLLTAGGALLLLVIGVLSALLLRSDGGKPEAAPEVVKLMVRSQPAGARIHIDGRDSGVVTDGVVALAAQRQQVLTLRKDGYREETRRLTPVHGQQEELRVELVAAQASVQILSDPSGATVTLDGRRLSGVTPLSIAIPTGTPHRLRVTLDGFDPQEVEIPGERVEPQLRVVLRPVGPQATVVLSAAYPVDVLWRGRVLAKGQARGQFSVSPGTQTFTLQSARHFLRTNLTVEARAGESVTLGAPGLGRINIKAQPDNCEVHIDGIFVDYPPILDRPIAAGSHRVLFKWPGAERSEELVEVVADRAVYVTGQMGRRE
jgi:eukaryotic-like serine/threonine-protein kinase